MTEEQANGVQANTLDYFRGQWVTLDPATEKESRRKTIVKPQPQDEPSGLAEELARDACGFIPGTSWHDGD